MQPPEALGLDHYMQRACGDCMLLANSEQMGRVPILPDVWCRSAARRLGSELMEVQAAAEDASRRATEAEATAASLRTELTAARTALEQTARSAAAADRCTLTFLSEQIDFHPKHSSSEVEQHSDDVEV